MEGEASQRNTSNESPAPAPSRPSRCSSRTATGSGRSRGDPVIGLDVAGKLFYCRQSTLLGVNAQSSYFAARFGPSSMMDPDLDFIDDRNRRVFFIDRDGDLFKYVLEYMRTQDLPAEIGTFGEHPNLWRALRKEAEFFALDGLMALLKVTHSCSPDQDGGKGILYWLGTCKGREEYVNPYTRGDVDVRGWFDETSALKDNWRENGYMYYGSSECREMLVQYRPKSKRFMEDNAMSDNVYCLMGCQHAGERLPVVVDLRKVVICPTHYSLRYGGCAGMEGDWNFQASEDDLNWVTLHEAREDKHLSGMNITDSESGERRWIRDVMKHTDDALKEEIYCDYFERVHRFCWTISPAIAEAEGKFFRYFRIIGASPKGSPDCLHAIGLEIYGHVSET